MDSPSSDSSSFNDDIQLLSPTPLSPINDTLFGQTRNGEVVMEDYEDNEDETSSLTDCSVTSDEFFGRNTNDLFPDEDESEWIHYLNETDRFDVHRGTTKIQPEDWTERLISDVGEDCELFLDSAKKEAMENCLLEVDHINRKIRTLLRKSYDDNVSIGEIIELALGEKSEFYIAISEALDLNRLQFLQFFGTLCLQMSYKESFDSLFDTGSSLLLDEILMTKEEYMEIWKKIGTMKKVGNKNYIGSSRREKCLWQILEVAVNTFLRSISIVGRDDDIPVALDDDKIWVHVSGKNDEDHFGLRKVTHVKDNRKGIISHTAVSLSTIMPLAFMFERKGNKATECFSKLFSDMFPPNEFSRLPDLNRVTVHSDRGYTLESTIFQYLIPGGANFTNTVKRIAPFPFLWGMKPKRGDTRTILKESGCPGLYVKEIVSNGKKVSCFAFRTGTSNISAVVSSTIEGHQWDGVCLSYKQRICWEADREHGLDKFLFCELATNPDLFLGTMLNVEDYLIYSKLRKLTC